MRQLGLFFSLALCPFLHAKDRVQWRTATVIYAHYQAERFTGEGRADIGTHNMGGSSVQTALGEFDFEAPEAIYRAEERVAIGSRMRLAEGDRVQLAVDGKAVLLQLARGKIRRLKLVATYAKPGGRVPR